MLKTDVLLNVLCL